MIEYYSGVFDATGTYAAILVLVIMSVGLTELLTQIEARMSYGRTQLKRHGILRPRTDHQAIRRVAQYRPAVQAARFGQASPQFLAGDPRPLTQQCIDFMRDCRHIVYANAMAEGGAMDHQGNVQ